MNKTIRFRASEEDAERLRILTENYLGYGDNASEAIRTLVRREVERLPPEAAPPLAQIAHHMRCIQRILDAASAIGVNALSPEYLALCDRPDRS